VIDEFVDVSTIRVLVGFRGHRGCTLYISPGVLIETIPGRPTVSNRLVVLRESRA
jgi:hypothetical protein